MGSLLPFTTNFFNSKNYICSYDVSLLEIKESVVMSDGRVKFVVTASPMFFEHHLAFRISLALKLLKIYGARVNNKKFFHKEFFLPLRALIIYFFHQQAPAFMVFGISPALKQKASETEFRRKGSANKNVLYRLAQNLAQKKLLLGVWLNLQGKMSIL